MKYCDATIIERSITKKVLYDSTLFYFCQLSQK